MDDSDHQVIFYNWKAFQTNFFKPLKNITKNHQFCISFTQPETVTCRRFSDSEPESFNLLKPCGTINPILLPAVLESKGINNDRQWYLFSEIRDFCYNVEAKNETCPKPLKPKFELVVPSTSELMVPTKKKKYVV